MVLSRAERARISIQAPHLEREGGGGVVELAISSAKLRKDVKLRVEGVAVSHSDALQAGQRKQRHAGRLTGLLASALQCRVATKPLERCP